MTRTKMAYDPERATFLSQLAADAAQAVKETEYHLEQTTRELEESRRLLTACRTVLLHYQKTNGISINGPDKRYATLGPTDALDLWAHEHHDTVVVRDSVTVLVASGGLYTTRRQAAGAIEGTLRRNKRFQRVAPGVWRRIKGSEKKAERSE